MQDIKFVMSIVILIICIPYLLSYAVEKIFHIRIPHLFDFLNESKNELSILAAASCVMGFMLVIF